VKRFFDLLLAILGMLIVLPFTLLIAIAIVVDSRGGVFYTQTRVGRHNKDFQLYKFRSMSTNADQHGQLTVGARDSRITRVGYFVRKTKLDELPQLINILKGDMSFVGPRPEVRKYVDLYSPEQMQVLQARPGLTDYASLEYIKENELLAKAEDPERTYIEEIMPAKLALNQKYIAEMGIGTDIKLLWLTFVKILKG